MAFSGPVGDAQFPQIEDGVCGDDDEAEERHDVGRVGTDGVDDARLDEWEECASEDGLGVYNSFLHPAINSVAYRCVVSGFRDLQ